MLRFRRAGYVCPFPPLHNLMYDVIIRRGIGLSVLRKAKKCVPPPPLPPFTPLTHSQPQIILIHGLSIPSLVYRDVAPILASKGYRILLYDLYGRGYSDAPQTVYDTSLYATQFALLMQHVGWERAGVVGVSMVSISRFGFGLKSTY
jgi:pimeloyl-ACP methyl ester carboxylesterase